MKGRRLRVLPAADAEYDEQVAWLEERSEDAAARFVRGVGEALDEIGKRPTRYPKYLGEFRSRMVFGFEIHVVYKFTDDEVLVYAIAHAKRRPGYWLDRLDEEPS